MNSIAVEVNVYTSAGPFPGSPLTIQASQPVLVPDQALTLFDLPLFLPTQPLPVDSIVVVEVHTPNGQVVGNSFFIGSNSSGQTGPSYISAAACAFPDPVDLASIGFPDVHIILNAAGTLQPRSFAENIASATAEINALMQPDIIGPAQKSLLLNLLAQASRYKDTIYSSLSLTLLNTVLARVDGCALRGTPDTVMTHGGAGLDFVTTCPGQAPIYSALKAAQAQLMPIR